MPNLRDLKLRISYGPGDDRLRAFFIPAMSASIRYDRAAGYFSSTMLAVASAGVTKLITNGGKMRLLCGADLSEADVTAINEGHATLQQKVEERLVTRWALPESDYIHNRLKALAWLVGTGQLEIKVVLPTDKSGQPLAASKSENYYHPKEGLFEDSAGNRIGFSGSVNESATALEDNYESFMVFNSWETAAHLAQIGHRFDRLWEGKERDWVAIPIPEAAKQKLLKLRPATPPTREFGVDEEEEELETPGLADLPERSELAADQRERIIFQFLRDVPHLLGAERLGMETCTVQPWPHQQRVADAIVRQFPNRFLLCDEVGLGKTVECGLAVRQLVLSGVVKRALFLVPKSVLVQWQEELYEKFLLNVPVYNGGTFQDVFGRELPGANLANPWDVHPILLASSHLAKRRERQQQLLEAQDWDLLIVDEAHHARRKDFLNREQFRPNRLLELLRGPQDRSGLCDKTRGLLLLTATPMQVDPVEVFDLLKLLGMGGRWGVESSFLRYFEELQQPFEEIDWRFIHAMLKDHFATGGQWDESFCRVAEQRLGPVGWHQVRHLHESSNSYSIIRQLDSKAQGVLRELVSRHTPLRRHVFRNTRNLLREYHRQGLLKANVPTREPRPEWIEMKPEEETLYHRIEEYIRDHYRKYEAERKGLGFIMTVYRRRLTSSFYAIERSLQRRLEYLKGELGGNWLTDEDVEEDDLEQDVSELLVYDEGTGDEGAKVPPVFLGEMEYVQDFLKELRSLGADSKFEQLARDLNQLLMHRDSVIVFTQYTDTMDYLRDKLRHVYGSQVACYSGRGGEQWDGCDWVVTSKESVKTAFRESQEIKILLCTESASEGLNLQTCGVLINYEMPWNPMRVEQRIGRIDRIGQIYDRVWIRNYFYDRTVEAIVYQRLDARIASFESVVGQLQPILTQVGRVIESAVMATNQERAKLIQQEVEAINRQIESAEISALDLDSLAAATLEVAEERKPPVTMLQLERAILGSTAFRDRMRPHPEIAGAHLFDWHGEWRAVTFDPDVFDQHPNTVTLMTWGDGILEEVLQVVQPPQEGGGRGDIVRCSLLSPWTLVAFYELSDAGQITNLATLQSSMQCVDQAQSRILDKEVALVKFSVACEAVIARDYKAAMDRQAAEVSSLAEEVRQLLTQAVYVELAQAANRGMFDEPLPLDFSPQGYERLKRHKVPFAGALRVVGNDLPTPRPDDPFYLRIRDQKMDVLTRRFDAIRSKLTERVRDLMTAKNSQPCQDGGMPTSFDPEGQVYLVSQDNIPGE